MKLLASIAPFFLYAVAVECTFDLHHILGLPKKLLSPLLFLAPSQPTPWPHNVFDTPYLPQPGYYTGYGEQLNPYFIDRAYPTGIHNAVPMPYYNAPDNHIPLNPYPLNDARVTQFKEAVDSHSDTGFQGDGQRSGRVFQGFDESHKAFIRKTFKDENNSGNEYLNLEGSHDSDRYQLPDQKEFLFETKRESMHAVPAKVIPYQSISPLHGNIMIVPLTNFSGMQTPIQNMKIIGYDVNSGLPVVNFNGVLYYYVNTPDEFITAAAQKPAQVISIQSNPYVNDINQLHSSNTIPNYILINGNDQTSSQSGGPVINGVANAATNGVIGIPNLVQIPGGAELYSQSPYVKSNIAGNSKDQKSDVIGQDPIGEDITQTEVPNVIDEEVATKTSPADINDETVEDGIDIKNIENND